MEHHWNTLREGIITSRTCIIASGPTYLTFLSRKIKQTEGKKPIRHNHKECPFWLGKFSFLSGPSFKGGSVICSLIPSTILVSLSWKITSICWKCNFKSWFFLPKRKSGNLSLCQKIFLGQSENVKQIYIFIPYA